MSRRSTYKPHNVRRGDPLTTRELQILALAAAGQSTPAISRRLGITENTVKTHLTSVYRKLGAQNRVQAARHYFDHYAIATAGDARGEPSGDRGANELIREQIHALESRLHRLAPSVREADRLRRMLQALHAIRLD